MLEVTQERFWSKVDRRGPDDCWLWQASCREGYGSIWIRGRKHGAHIFAWELTHGTVPKGMFVCHSCDARYAPGDITYRRCVNPAHLWIGTNADNMADMAKKGRAAVGDRNASRRHPERLARGELHGSHTHPERWARGDLHWSRMNPERTARGERNGYSKLTVDMVREIRQRVAAGEMQSEVAASFGVTTQNISLIVSRRTWKHVI